MTRNPFTPPTTPVADSPLNPLLGRPALVSVIAIYYGFAALLSVTVGLFIVGRPDVVPAAVRAPFVALGGWYMAYWLALVAMKAWAAVAIFRLKSYSIVLLTVLCAIGVFSSVRVLAHRNWHGNLGTSQAVGQVVGALFGSFLSIAIIVYAVRLRRRGILNP